MGEIHMGEVLQPKVIRIIHINQVVRIIQTLLTMLLPQWTQVMVENAARQKVKNPVK